MVKTSLAQLSWVEAQKYFSENDIVILPIGSTEQHGPQNPLGTDHLIAEKIAEKVSEKTGILSMPVIPYGVSRHHKHFPGTIYVSENIFEKYVEEVCTSLIRYGVSKILVINGHGGNLSSLIKVSGELREKYNVFMVIMQWWSLSSIKNLGIFKGDERYHAGAEETSLMMYLYPSLVDLDKAVDEKPKKLSLSKYNVYYYTYTRDISESGVHGRVRTASKERGKKVFDIIVEETIKILDEMRNLRLSR